MICPKCNKDNDFRPNKKRANGLQAYCVQCDKEYQHAWYLKNKDKAKARAKKHNAVNRNRNQPLIWKYLEDKSCKDCGNTNRIVLEFDHIIGNKEHNISKMCNSTFTWETVLAEIEKCEVVCANCHRIRTAKRGNHYKYKMSQMAG
jgi:hypothetical protein